MQYAQDGCCVLPAAITVDEQQGLQTLNLQSSTGQQRLSIHTLDRCETQNAPTIVAQQESNPAIAQQALRIEHDDHDQGLAVARSRWPR